MRATLPAPPAMAPRDDPSAPTYRELQAGLLQGLALVGAVVVAGVTGYMTLQGWTFVEALYMTITTLTTVGFMEVRPLDAAGRLFTIGLIVTGVGSFTFLAGRFTEYVIGGSLTGVVRSRRMQHRIDAMAGHQIVCGYGRVGEQVALDLAAEGLAVVVVEKEGRALDRIGDRFPYVIGDATDEDVLTRAGIARAAGLVAASGEDTANIVITLTARGMNGALQIVARGGADETASKLMRAGATHVISPYRLAGRRIAMQLQHPRVSDFLDLVMHSRDLELWLKEVRVGGGSTLAGRTLAECALASELGVTVLAVNDGTGGRLLTPPPPAHRLASGDVLIVLGTNDQLQRLQRAAGGTE